MMSSTTTSRRREIILEACQRAQLERASADAYVSARLAVRRPHVQLVPWDGPEGEEYAVFELDARFERVSEYPVSTGTYESELAFARSYDGSYAVV